MTRLILGLYFAISSLFGLAEGDEDDEGGGYVDPNG